MTNAVTVSLDFQNAFLANPERFVLGQITDALNESGRELEQHLRSNAPRDLGDHSSGYEWQRIEFVNDELRGALVNEVPNSLFRERGRPPGRRPPVTALEGWARRRGLSPYLVAKKIGDEGTQRWIENKNPLGIDRTSTATDIKVNSDSIVRAKLDEGIAAANELEY